jgi:hypothetical protein
MDEKPSIARGDRSLSRSTLSWQAYGRRLPLASEWWIITPSSPGTRSDPCTRFFGLRSWVAVDNKCSSAGIAMRWESVRLRVARRQRQLAIFVMNIVTLNWSWMLDGHDVWLTVIHGYGYQRLGRLRLSWESSKAGKGMVLNDIDIDIDMATELGAYV